MLNENKTGEDKLKSVFKWDMKGLLESSNQEEPGPSSKPVCVCDTLI